MNVTRVVVNDMISQPPGQMINISSINGRKAASKGSGYSASKFGVVGFSESLRREVSEQGVRVTVLLPSAVDTEMLNSVDVGDKRLLEPTDIADIIDYIGHCLAEHLLSRGSAI